jgi:hypothetical protein
MRIELEENPHDVMTHMDDYGVIRAAPSVTVLVHFDEGESMNAARGAQISVLKYFIREAWLRLHDATWHGPQQ